MARTRRTKAAGEPVVALKLDRGGFTDREIWDVASVAGFFDMTNRVATASEMRPNREYTYRARSRP